MQLKLLAGEFINGYTREIDGEKRKEPTPNGEKKISICNEKSIKVLNN